MAIPIMSAMSLPANTTKPTVLAINKFHYRLGGVETYYLSLMTLLRQQGHHVIPFAMQHPENEPSDWDDWFVSQVDYRKNSIGEKIRSAARSLYSIETRHRLRQLIRATSPRLAHIQHIYHQLSTSVLDELRTHGIPIVQTVHDYKMVCPSRQMFLYKQQENCYRCKNHHYYHAVLQNCVPLGRAASLLASIEAYIEWIVKPYIRCVDHFISPAAFLRDRLIEAGVPSNRVSVVNYFIDSSSYDPHYDGEYVLYVGRLEPEKGVHILTQAAARLPHIQFKIVGTGSQEALLRETNRDFPNIEFLGKLKPAAVRKVMENSRFVVVPSLCHDVSPLVLLEAFASGKPVVASAVGGIPEVVKDHVTGLTFPAGSHEALCEHIAHLYESPEKITSMGKSGRRQVEIHHSPDAHYRAINQIYQSLL